MKRKQIQPNQIRPNKSNLRIYGAQYEPQQPRFDIIRAKTSKVIQVD